MHGGLPRPLSLSLGSLSPSPTMVVWHEGPPRTRGGTQRVPKHVDRHPYSPLLLHQRSTHSLVATCHRTSPTQSGPSTVSTVRQKTYLDFVLSDNICLLMCFMWVERFSLVHELELSTMRYKDYASTKGDGHRMGDLLELAIWKCLRIEDRWSNFTLIGALYCAPVEVAPKLSYNA
jgi:hypothetical protein